MSDQERAGRPVSGDLVTPSLECYEGEPHTWDSLGNARYRCSTCGAFGYRRQIVQHMRSLPTDSQGISIRRCVKVTEGKRCGKPAVARDTSNHGRTKTWRCGKHRV